MNVEERFNLIIRNTEDIENSTQPLNAVFQFKANSTLKRYWYFSDNVYEESLFSRFAESINFHTLLIKAARGMFDNATKIRAFIEIV